MSDKCMHCHNEETCPEGAKTKARSEEEQQKLLNRLSRIEGQIRGIKKMVEENRYCTDILTQSAAAAQAMNAFSRELLDEHLRSCVAENLKAGNTEIVDELIDTLHKLMK